MSTVPEYDAVRVVLEILERLKIPHAVTGSFSSSYYGQRRSTDDADILIDAAEDCVVRLSHALQGEFAVDPQLSFDTITGTPRLVAKHRPTGSKVEFFFVTDDENHRVRFSRRRPASIFGIRSFVVTPEDVIVQKLLWTRLGRGTRAKDFEDAVKVFAVQRPHLDMGYIRDWTDRHGTSELLQRLVNWVGGPPGSAPRAE
jgi:hypothetical protein